MTVKVNQQAGKAPGALVATLVASQPYPFFLALQHKCKKPLVVPSSGINTPIPGGAEPVKVKVRNYDQAWLLVTDLAELARLNGNTDEDFAQLTADPVAAVEVPAETPAETPVAETKPAKAKASTTVEGQ